MDCFVKESYGVIRHFYHNRHGICFCTMRDEKITEYQALLPDAREDFDVVVDDSNVTHMVCQNNDGDILYVNHQNGSWKKTTLLKSKKSTAYKKDFIIKRVGNWLNIFYCIEYNGKRMLTHQIVERDDVEPFVVDCISGSFSAATDSMGNIYLLFYSETQKCRGIRKYLWAQKNWEDFSAVEALRDAKNCYLYIDREDKLHVVYEIDGCIRHYTEEKTEVLGVGTSPIMLFQKEEIVMWEGIGDSKVYIRRAADKAPTVFMPGGFAKPVRFRLRYTSYEPDINADMCLGNITDGGVKTYGVRNFFSVSSSPPSISPSDKTGTPKTANAPFIELQKLKIQVGQLENTVEKLRAEIAEIDTQKTDRRLCELEETIRHSGHMSFVPKKNGADF